MGFCTLKLQQDTPGINLTPTLLLFSFRVTMKQLTSTLNIYERLNVHPS